MRGQTRDHLFQKIGFRKRRTHEWVEFDQSADGAMIFFIYLIFLIYFSESGY